MFTLLDFGSFLKINRIVSKSLAQTVEVFSMQPNRPTCHYAQKSRKSMILIIQFVDFLDFCRMWHLGGFGSMENTPTGHADDLPTIFAVFKNDPKSRSVNILSSN